MIWPFKKTKSVSSPLPFSDFVMRKGTSDMWEVWPVKVQFPANGIFVTGGTPQEALQNLIDYKVFDVTPRKTKTDS